LAKFIYEIFETVAVLSEGKKGWQKELNLISWNGREPVYDIWEWAKDHQKLGKGVTFKQSELQVLKESLAKLREFD